MRWLVAFLAIHLFLSVVAAPAAAQSGSITQIEQQLVEKLTTFDQKSVKAAMSYAKTFDFARQMLESAKQVAPSLVDLIKTKNPELALADIEIFVNEYLDVALIGSTSFIEKWTIVAMLEIFSTEELIALDQFYASEVGRSIISKFPATMARIPQLLAFVELQSGDSAITRARFDAKMNLEFSKFPPDQVAKIKYYVAKAQIKAQFQNVDQKFLPYIEELIALSNLEIFEKREIDALHHFVTTGAGETGMNKMPKMAARLPEAFQVAQQHFVPAGLAAAMSKLRAMGKEIRI